MFAWLKRLLGRGSEKPEFLWALTGNIRKEGLAEPGGAETCSGTKHFSAGTKVYCFPPLWGDGYEKIKVIGHHRGSKRFARLVMKSSAITNWRCSKVYSPTMQRLIHGEAKQFWESEKEVKRMVASLREREEKP